jgi:hypothetical protein
MATNGHTLAGPHYHASIRDGDPPGFQYRTLHGYNLHCPIGRSMLSSSYWHLSLLVLAAVTLLAPQEASAAECTAGEATTYR